MGYKKQASFQSFCADTLLVIINVAIMKGDGKMYAINHEI